MTEQTHPTAAIKTLGCKLNQFESEQIREQLADMGCRIVPFETSADIYVINTCTVTSRTDRDSRRLIRHAKKLNAASFVAVTGCYAEVNPQVLRDIPQADLVVGNAGKAQLGHLIRARLDGSLQWPDPDADGPTCFRGCEHSLVRRFADHTRAFVKIQEGCDGHCTYCIIPRARGRSRSTPFADVLLQTLRLVEAGHPEIVLIGTHLGQYGRDLPDGPDLVQVIEKLCRIPDLGRIRLSSIEPCEVPESLIDLVAGHPKVCRHLHIPLQSGCDSVLKRMARPYDAAFYAELVRRTHLVDPGICLGADVIVGFPGETQEEFATTLKMLQALPLSYLHVFTYSVRPGTPAAEMPDQVDYETKRARNHVLRDLSEAKRASFARSMIGADLETVLERPAKHEPGVLDGLTDNYLRVYTEGSADLLHTLRTVVATAATDGYLRGSLATEAGEV